MSQENVDQFAKSIEAFNRMDIPGVLQLLHPEVQFEHRLAELYGSYSGLDGWRLSSMAPGLVTPEKAAKGKLPTDVWWHTIVPTNGKEKTGYPSQKPEGIIRRMIQASTRPGDWCLDFFAGSGTVGAVAKKLGRRYVLIDSNPDAIDVMQRRLVPLPAPRAHTGR